MDPGRTYAKGTGKRKCRVTSIPATDDSNISQATIRAPRQGRGRLAAPFRSRFERLTF